MNATIRLSIAILLGAQGFLSLSCSDGMHSQEESAKNVILQPEDSSERMAWFRDAKYGLFIHWGPYSALAGEWEGRQVPTDSIAEWIMHHLQIPVDEYRERARLFNPEEFDADEWVQLAKDAGMKYVVITSKHHDGFAMYDSEVSDYNIVDWTPFGSDPIRELADACARHGLKFGMYYSQREDWDEPFGYGNTWDFDFDPSQNIETFESEYLFKKAEPQVRELLTNYGPLGLIWFDRGLYTQEEAKRFTDLVHEIQPGCLVNGRVGGYDQELAGDYQSLSDNGMPIGGIEEYWESPGTLNDTWGYSKFDTNWKSPAEVVERLVRIVSAGGNYLLNVGPTGEGIIPAASVDVLREVGSWLQANGEGIYGASAGPFAPLPFGYVTAKEKMLYLYVIRWPASGKILLPGLQNDVEHVFSLNSIDTELPIDRVGNDLQIDISNLSPDRLSTAIAVALDGPPAVDAPSVGQSSEGTVVLDYLSAVTEQGAVKRYNRKGGFHIGGLKTTDDAVTWTIKTPKPGKYALDLQYATRENWPPGALGVTIFDQDFAVDLPPSGDWYDYAEVRVGTVDIAEGSSGTLRTQLTSDAGDRLLYLKSLVLQPLK